MLSLVILLFLSVSAYEKISKYGSASVIPNTQVYLDISSFKVGENITIEFIMDLFLGGSRTEYDFYIRQSLTDSYEDSYYWSHLYHNTSRNVSCSSSASCTFRWTEKKEVGAHYLYIKPPAPYSSFYDTWRKTIKVSHTGGLSAGAIAGIVIGCVAGAVVFIIIIYYCCCHNQKPDYAVTSPTVPMTYSQPIVQPVVTPVQPVIQPVQPVIQPVQPVIQPAVPTYYPPPSQPYYPPTAVY